MKAFLGMGLLGSNFVKAMIKKGEVVQVWNRNPARAQALAPFGAIAIANVADAVKAAGVIHLTVKDDAATDEVLAAARAGFEPGVIIIDHTTTSAKGAIERTAYWKAQGYTYLHAPVFMGPVNALESTGTMLVSGDQEVIGKVTEQLSAMTGKLMNLGGEEGRAAAIKLIGNSFLLSLSAGLSDALALGKAQGVTPAEVLEFFSTWNPGASMPARLKRMLDADFANPSWELNMARKDAGLMMSAVKDSGNELAVIPVVAAQMDEWIAAGHGSQDWSIIAKNNIV